MSASVKVLLGPQDTDFGIARLVELPDGADRIEVFDEAGKVWRVSSNPDLTLWDLAASEPLSPAIAKRLGLTDPDVDHSDSLRQSQGLPPAPPMQLNHQGPMGEELKRRGDEMVKLFLRNLNFNVLHDIDPDAPESERQAAYARLRNEEFGWLDLPRVVTPDTVAAIEKHCSLRGWQIADRWAAGAPKKVKEMEAAGQLLPRLKEQADLENETISNARVGGAMNDTPDSEILALNEIPALPD